MNTRRGFLGIIGAAMAVAALDPERALWVPGKRMISIPKPLATAGDEWGSIVLETSQIRRVIGDEYLKHLAGLKLDFPVRFVPKMNRLDLLHGFGQMNQGATVYLQS
jgi:hypothetical protein